MKKILCLVLAGVYSVLCIAGCGVDIGTVNEGDKLNIVCTTFPQYDWVSNIIKGNEENINLTYLMENGGDLHNFQPSALDMAKVSGCDIFIYVGGESDTWVSDALKEAVNPDLTAVNMMEVLCGNGGLYLEDEEGDGEYDEHVWLSLRNAAFLCEYLCGVLSEADEENAILYRRNCKNYVAEIEMLDDEYKNAVNESRTKTLLFADRFPFRYLTKDYGLNYYAAFEGCSAETEASFYTVAFLADKLSELGLGAVCVVDGSDKRLAQVVIENSDNEDRGIVVFNSMQSVSKADIENNVTYLCVMEDNLASLRAALVLQ